MVHVQTDFVSLAGEVGVGVEGSNATVQGDDKYHPNSGSTLAVPPMDPYGPVTRYFDVFSRGTKECEWTASPWQPFVKLSQYTGTVGPSAGDTRVYISIDWSAVPDAPYSTIVNINVTTPCRGMDRYGFPLPRVQVPVIKRAVPANFTAGFVESDGHVSISGAHYQSILPPAQNSSLNNNVTYHKFAHYGRTGSGVGLVPLNTEKQTPQTAPALEYNLYLFSNHSAANVTLLISPALNYLGDYDPLEYAVSLAPQGGNAADVPVKSVRPVGATVGSNMPAGWGTAVADNVWGLRGGYTTTSFAVPREGAYTLRVWALMPGVVVQKILLDLGGVRASYLGPPESFLVGRDTLGARNGTSFLNEPDAVGGVGKGRCKRKVAMV
jgi:hypothetical protein